MRQDPPLRLSEFLPYQLSVAAESVSRAFARCYEAEFGLTIPEWRVMAVIGEAGALSTQAVIARTEMDRVKVSRAAIRLADKGLLARSAPPGDARAHVLRLSESGLDLYRRIVPRAHALNARMAEALSEPDLATLSHALVRLRDVAARLIEDRDRCMHAAGEAR